VKNFLHRRGNAEPFAVAHLAAQFFLQIQVLILQLVGAFAIGNIARNKHRAIFAVDF